MYNNSGINKVFLAGTISKEPRLHKTVNHPDMLCFLLITHERFPAGGKMVDHFETHHVKILSTLLTLELAKGKMIYVEGKIHTESYTDTQNIRRYKTEIIGNRVAELTPVEWEEMIKR